EGLIGNEANLYGFQQGEPAKLPPELLEDYNASIEEEEGNSWPSPPRGRLDRSSPLASREGPTRVWAVRSSSGRPRPTTRSSATSTSSPPSCSSCSAGCWR